MDKVRACVVGATGYAGVELVRLLVAHPVLKLTMATDRTCAGTRLHELYPALRGVCDIELVQPDVASIVEAADLAFLAVPHTAALDLVPPLLAAGVSVVDLSADYRLKDAHTYETWYRAAHTSPELLSETVYALPELYRANLAELAARRAAGTPVLVSVPGCYPTATLLAAAPALRSGVATGDTVMASAISGVSGAGRTPSARTHYCHANESVEPYGVASHRHTPEIEQVLTDVAGREMGVVFVPHLAPLTRGLLSTVYLDLTKGSTEADVFAAYEAAYANEALVDLLPFGTMPATGSVRGTARAQIGIACDLRRRNTIIAACAIDNLGKGAAAQAVQATNAVLQISETCGLATPSAIV